jgi:membrane protease YdiL (CAAX protease family)
VTDPTDTPTPPAPDADTRGASPPPGSPGWPGWPPPAGRAAPPIDRPNGWRSLAGPTTLPPRQRNPLPTPAGPPRALRIQLGLVLLLAFAPGILGLLVLAFGTGDTAEVPSQLVPAILSGMFQLVVSWTPVLVIGYLLARSREGWPGIGLTRFQAGDLRMGLVLWVASFVLVLVLAQLFQHFGQREVDFLPPDLPLWFRVVQAVSIAVTAGFTEEVVVRGYAQTRLEQLRAPTAAIVLLPTAIWGVLHVYQGLGAALTIFCLGLLYAWSFQRTRRLWPLILAHGLFNMTQLVFILAGG